MQTNDRDKLIDKLVSILEIASRDTTIDHEADAAVRAAVRIVKSSGIEWKSLLKGGSSSHSGFHRGPSSFGGGFGESVFDVSTILRRKTDEIDRRTREAEAAERKAREAANAARQAAQYAEKQRRKVDDLTPAELDDAFVRHVCEFLLKIEDLSKIDRRWVRQVAGQWTDQGRMTLSQREALIFLFVQNGGE